MAKLELLMGVKNYPDSLYYFYCLISLNFHIIFIHDRTIYCVDLF
jgi:hypothetical protein